jgi:DNA-3-methyladenine glycosylase II
MSVANHTLLTQAAKYLSDADPVLKPIINKSGLPTITPQTHYYSRLITSIISQQLSVKAAAAIQKRFTELFNSETPDPEAILKADPELLKATGLSRPKISYIRDLAEHIIAGELDFSNFTNLSNKEIITELTRVKGIGEWTAHMFLMFCMGRLDILAYGDLGVRNGVQALYTLESVPSPEEVQQIAKQNHWHPYESAACWYIWRSLENKPI